MIVLDHHHHHHYHHHDHDHDQTCFKCFCGRPCYTKSLPFKLLELYTMHHFTTLALLQLMMPMVGKMGRGGGGAGARGLFCESSFTSFHHCKGELSKLLRVIGAVQRL